jgi:hypothetical protein
VLIILCGFGLFFFIFLGCPIISEYYGNHVKSEKNPEKYKEYRKKVIIFNLLPFNIIINMINAGFFFSIFFLVYTGITGDVDFNEGLPTIIFIIGRYYPFICIIDL